MKTLILSLLLAVGVFAQGSLYFPAGQPSNVAFARMWKVDTPYGDHFFETWVKPKEKQWLGYFASDGDAGQHIVLVGYQSDNERWRITGNFYTGSGFFNYTTPIVGRLNEWTHVAIGLKDGVFRVWANGKTVFEQPYSGARMTLAGGSNGNLYIGGSFHLNCGCNIARARYIEGYCPFNTDFRPSMYFTRKVIVDHVENFVNATWGADFSAATEYFADYGTGFKDTLHDGAFSRWSSTDGLPVFQNDRVSADTTNVYTPAAVPDGALVFDSFNRPPVAYGLHDILSLGQTEAGSLGRLAWSSDGWGIIGEQAFCQYNTNYFNTVETARENVSVRASRPPGANTGLTLRFTDSCNNVRVIGETSRVVVVETNNCQSKIGEYAVNNYSILRADANGNQLKIYTDGALVASRSVSLSGTRHGLTYAGAMTFADDFTIFPVQ